MFLNSPKKGLWIFPKNAWYFWSLEAWALLDPQSASILFIVTMRVHEPSLTQVTFLEAKSIIFGKNREPSIIPTTSGIIRKRSNIIGGPGFWILRFILTTPVVSIITPYGGNGRYSDKTDVVTLLCSANVDMGAAESPEDYSLQTQVDP